MQVNLDTDSYPGVHLEYTDVSLAPHRHGVLDDRLKMPAIAHMMPATDKAEQTSISNSMLHHELDGASCDYCHVCHGTSLLSRCAY